MPFGDFPYFFKTFINTVYIKNFSWHGISEKTLMGEGVSNEKNLQNRNVKLHVHKQQEKTNTMEVGTTEIFAVYYH